MKFLQNYYQNIRNASDSCQKAASFQVQGWGIQVLVCPAAGHMFLLPPWLL